MILVGDEARIQSLLKKINNPKAAFLHTLPEVIEMSEPAATSVWREESQL